MNATRMPGFTAAGSLYKTKNHYMMAGSFGRCRASVAMCKPALSSSREQQDPAIPSPRINTEVMTDVSLIRKGKTMQGPKARPTKLKRTSDSQTDL